jgi:hypothetical protein
MKNIYTAFQYGTYTSPRRDILNVTLENEMYNEKVMGSRDIIEEKVQGIDTPIFFYLDNNALAFEVNIAFEGKTKTQINELLGVLISPKTYTLLTFGEYVKTGSGEEDIDYEYQARTPFYRSLFIGEPEINFIGRNYQNALIYDGYITAEVRCDRPYAFTFENLDNISRASSGFLYNNASFFSIYPNLSITNTSGSAINFLIQRSSVSNFALITSQFGFNNLQNNESITVNGKFFSITSNQVSNTYSRWDKNHLILLPGNINYLRVIPNSTTLTSGLTVSLSYESPTLIKVV